MKKYIFLHLDGTIINSMEGIAESVQYSLKHMGIIEKDKNQLAKFIGPPPRYSFAKFWGIKEDDLDRVMKKYREYYKEIGIYKNELYPGMEKMLKSLYNKDFKLIVATSKPEVFAKKILKNLNIDQYFMDICGSSLDGSRSEKKDVITYALNKNHIKDVSEVIMVGDRHYDVEGAKVNSIEAVGVLYGFGSKDELEKAGANYIVATVEDLEKLILQNT